MDNIEEKRIEAGKLRHKRQLTFFQLIIAFLTAAILSSAFNILSKDSTNPVKLILSNFGIPESAFIGFLITIAVLVILYYDFVFDSLERELGWYESKSEDDKIEEMI